ncbi:MAG: 50S ribosomal protein L1 [Deltaproteobacteria bacterium]|nr:50S ribosomal protein L1 [Deltaproteobacteria bacterium]
MIMAGKKYQEVSNKVEQIKKYSLDEATKLLTELKTANFDESVDVAIGLGIDAKQSDQMVRGAVALPHGTGKKLRILVFAKGEKETEAKEAGADYVGGEDLVEKVQGGWLDFDKVVSTPDMMAVVSKLGKILGPRGMMPNPKVGTVSFEVAKVIKELKAGRVEFRNDKAGILHAAVGKLSFGPEKIKENFMAFLEAVKKAKPPSSKGAYLRSISLAPTMGPAVKVDTVAFL